MPLRHIKSAFCLDPVSDLVLTKVPVSFNILLMLRSDQAVHQQCEENQQLCEGRGEGGRRQEGESRHREETGGGELRLG